MSVPAEDEAVSPDPLIVQASRVLNGLNPFPLYPWVYETAHEDSYVPGEKLQSLGWEPPYSNKEAFIETFEWHLESYNGTPDLSGRVHRVVQDQDTIALAKMFFSPICARNVIIF